jgi:hypothetical protein
MPLRNYKLTTERRQLMKKTMNRASVFFFLLTLLTLTVGITTQSTSQDAEMTVSANPEVQLPDEDSAYLNAVLSALGGFSGGGLLLIFLLRRLVTSYDDTFAKVEQRLDTQNKKAEEKNDKIIEMINDVQDSTQELKMEIIKLQANAVDKNTITEALTKVAMLEVDVEQVRGEVKSIMTHLLNKPRASGITNIRS